MNKINKKIWVWLRRLSQMAFFVFWVHLFIETALHATESLIIPDLFMYMDPLAAILATTSARVFVPALLWTLVFIILTLILGRFFCGWICPLGSVLDFTAFIWKKPSNKVLSNEKSLRNLKYYILAILSISAIVGSQLSYLFDPLPLMFRSITFGLFPKNGGETNILSFIIFLIIIGLTIIVPRFWCRYLCPLGALYAALSRFSIIRRKITTCNACKDLDERGCNKSCLMGANPLVKSDPSECIRCMACLPECHSESVKFKPTVPLPSNREVKLVLNRRTFLISLTAGTAAGISTTLADSKKLKWKIVRPPQVTNNTVFNSLCVRCGQCIVSCPTGTLQPLFLEGGFQSFWTPAITPHIGGCKEDCNECSAVCMTDAIPKFGIKRQEKWSVKMGTAVLETGRCISYEPNAEKPCLKCIAVCPNKAITQFKDNKPLRPKSIIFERCTGCGLCEYECLKMVSGAPAITLSSKGVGNPVTVLIDPEPDLPDCLKKAKEEKK